MLKKTIILFFVCLAFYSCNHFNFKKQNRIQIATQQIEALKNEGLENYPEIKPCENELPKNCFENQLISHINDYFTETVINEYKWKKDSLSVFITVSNSGKLGVKLFKKEDTVAFNIIKNRLEQALLDLSPIKPASIKGVSVNCQFKLPIIFANKS